MTTPDNIAQLTDNQIFVFGSNLNGNHAGGAAKLAKDNFGAKEGVGEGLVGQAYAFPTLDKGMRPVSIYDLKKSKEELYRVAEANQDKQFLVTKVGCGIAGFLEEEMKKVFSGYKPLNVVLPAGWSVIRGYKAFEKGLICRGFQYEFGKDFVHDGKIQLCQSGFHFCKSLGDVYNYYNFGTSIVVCEVESEGEVIDENDGGKSVTNHLRLVRILNPEEASNNNGINNLGHSNTGDSNTGHRNTGHWNTANYHTGSFNTVDADTILVFNKPCNREVWEKAGKPWCLNFDIKKWVSFSDMTDEDKKTHPSAKTVGGYYKEIPYKEAFSESMKKAPKEELKQIKALPNFDADIFEEISGFKII